MSAHDLPFFEQESQIRTSYMLAQEIFTPQNTALVNPDPKDRPYAGYLYLGLGLLGASLMAGRLAAWPVAGQG